MRDRSRYAHVRGLAVTAQWHVLGPELRAAREATSVTLRAAAKALHLAPSTLSLAERGGPVLGRAMLLELARHYSLDRAAEERWLALAGHLPVAVDVGVSGALASGAERAKVLPMRRTKGDG